MDTGQPTGGGVDAAGEPCVGIDQQRVEVIELVEQETADEAQRRWKLDHGIPILCVDREDYRRFCRLTLGPLSYEKRKLAMKFTPVTSEMNVKQMVKFMDAVERECLEQGIVLTQPDQELASYQSRYREPKTRAA